LEFLIEDLVAAGCEVRLMKSNSIRHNPGAMWRFLALADTDKLITVLDADLASSPKTDMQRTELLELGGLGWWRVPVWLELNEVGNVHYRPFVGQQFGCRSGLGEIRLMMEALVWATQNGKIDNFAKIPGRPPTTIQGTVWPDYGFDEWFLQAAVYPRAAYDGVLTFIPSEIKTRLIALDIQYATRANGRSEVHYFGAPDDSAAAEENCCGTTTGSSQKIVVLRPDTAVVLRSAKPKEDMMLAAFKPTDEVLPVRLKRGAEYSLGYSQSHVKSTWWVDLPELVRAVKSRAELFLERHYSNHDVVVTGAVFVTLDTTQSKWAVKQGADLKNWAVGAIRKLPKLNGSMTLWKTEFSRIIYKEWSASKQAVSLELMLAVWEELGKVKVGHGSVTAQGWDCYS
jgi:hypothetical protein